MNIKETAEYDRLHVWHPYASMKNPPKVYQVESAEGAVLTFADGRKAIDGMSSWWAVAHGYKNPKIDAAIKGQMAKMSHVMFGGLTHEGAVKLAKTLVEMTPAALQKVFFCDSGSVSVEVAMKMALQFWRAKGDAKKTKFATARGGYHGDTWHAMSVCDPVNGMHSLFSGGLPIHYFAARPEIKFDGEWNDADISSMREILAEKHSEIAAVIIEPIVQGAGGMRFYHPQYLRELKKLCEEFCVLLILDEIATGFGRSGKMFACEWAGVSPDIMCLGKALTGGYVSFAATLATDDVADTISENGVGLFMHGPTFMANPLACAAANASMEIVRNENVLQKVAGIERVLREKILPLKDCDSVADARVLGAIGVLEMKENIDVPAIQEKLVNRGVWLRPFGKLLYTMPPYIISPDELLMLTGAIADVVK